MIGVRKYSKSDNGIGCEPTLDYFLILHMPLCHRCLVLNNEDMHIITASPSGKGGRGDKSYTLSPELSFNVKLS